MMRSIVFFLILIFSPQLWASNHMLVMGGGGEPKRDYTIFDYEIEKVGSFVQQNKNWKTSISFNGGHSKTEKIINGKFNSVGARNSTFTPESYSSLIRSYINKIKNNEIKSGDQLMVFINSHGGARDSKNKTHTIATSKEVVTDFNNLNGGTVSLDELEQLSKLAQEKNIKLALIDFSCHSGNTMALKNPKTCVISSTGPDHYGFGGNETTFTALFTKNMQRGKSLEDVYLESRKSFLDRSFPMISSPIGEGLQEEMYKPITPFLYYYSPKNDKFTPFITNEVASDNPSCINGGGVNALFRLSREAEQMMDASMRASLNDKNFKKFNAAIGEYYLQLKELHDKLSKMGVGIFKNQEKFCTKYASKPGVTANECVTYTVQNIFTLDFNKIGQYYRDQVNISTGANKKRYEAMIANLDKVKARKSELMRKYPDLVNFKSFNEMLPNLEKQTRDLTFRVARESQKLYYALYKQRSSKSRAPNPCKDFVL